jgi:hypothetical protein
MNCIPSQGINHFKILLEHIRVLIIFARNILLYSGRQGDTVRLAKWEGENIATWVSGSSYIWDSTWWAITYLAISAREQEQTTRSQVGILHACSHTGSDVFPVPALRFVAAL